MSRTSGARTWARARSFRSASGGIGSPVSVLVAESSSSPAPPLQPTAGIFGWHALIAFAGSVVYALFLIVTRMLRGTDDTIMATWQVWTALGFGAITAWWHWAPIADPTDVGLLLLLGVVALGGIVCVNRALAYAPASVVVPYQYTLIVWAILFGYVFFGDLPAPLTLLGAAIIAAAGLFIYFRERKVAGEMSSDVVPGP